MPKDDIQGMFQYLGSKTIALFTGVATNFLMTTLKGIRAIYGPRTTTTAITTTTTTSTVLANRIIHPCTEPIRAWLRLDQSEYIIFIFIQSEQTKIV